MKKYTVLFMIIALCSSSSLLATVLEPNNGETVDVTISDQTKHDAAALTTALLGIAGELLSDLPGIITDISKFPDAVKDDVKSLQQGMIAAAALTGAAKDKKVQELFVYGVNLTILLSNIINKFMIIIAKIGPVAEAIDAKEGHKVDEALKLALAIMQMISKINIAMKNSILAQGTTTVAASAQATPKLDPIPDL